MSAVLDAPARSNGHKKATKIPRPKHPAETSTTAPAGLEARYGMHPVMAATIAEEQLVELRLIHAHPDNRKLRDDDPDVIELAGSLEVDGLLQAITVRVAPEHWDLPKGHYQLVDGERRWRAARVAGQKTIRCKVREDLDDAATKRLLAVANAQRKDLNAIEKAQLIERLCTANSDGSPPLTREQAAQTIGLETGAAASNLVRLLELPQRWQARVASGELPWTWARELLPVVKLEPVLKELDHDWANRETDRWDNAFLSRADLKEQIESIVDQACPRLDAEHYVAGGRGKLKIDAGDPQVREQFGIVEVELAIGKRGQTETVLLATDKKAFEAALEKQLAKKTKASAAKAGEDDAPAPRELTAAEKREKAAERGRQRSERIAAWRDKLLRRVLASRVAQGEDDGLRLVIAYAANPCFSFRKPQLHDLLAAAVPGKKPRADRFRENYWPLVEAAGTLNGAISTMAEQLLKDKPPDWRSPTLPYSLVEDFASDLHVDVAKAWLDLQESRGAKLAGEDLLEEFFLLHQTAELQDLAKELGVHLLPSMSTRAKIVEFLLSVPRGTTRRLPLPKSIKPLALAGKTTKGAKATKGK